MNLPNDHEMENVILRTREWAECSLEPQSRGQVAACSEVRGPARETGRMGLALPERHTRVCGEAPGREDGMDKDTRDFKGSGKVERGETGWKTGPAPTASGHLSEDENFGLRGIEGWHPSGS